MKTGGAATEWRMDQMARLRGLSSKTFFVRLKAVGDGGDDSDPTYVPSPRYEVIVQCAHW